MYSAFTLLTAVRVVLVQELLRFTSLLTSQCPHFQTCGTPPSPTCCLYSSNRARATARCCESLSIWLVNIILCTVLHFQSRLANIVTQASRSRLPFQSILTLGVRARSSFSAVAAFGACLTCRLNTATRKRRHHSPVSLCPPSFI